MKTLLVLSVLALAALQGCSKSEDSNQDANGACKQEYLDSWNAVARLTKYSSMSEATSACTNLKNKSGVSCKANVMVISGSAQSGDRNISYNDHKAVCDAVLSSTSSTPTTPSSPYAPSTPPTPSSKYSALSGNACSNGFLDLYNGIVKKAGQIKSAAAYGDSVNVARLLEELVPSCAEKKVAHAESPSCYSVKSNSYNYGYNTASSTSMSEFDAVCELAEKMVADRQQAELARSVRVLSKIETFDATVESYSDMKKFNSVGGATYLIEGVWLKEASAKAKLATATEDTVACNVTTKAVLVDGTEFKGSDIVLSKVEQVVAETQELVQLNKAEFKLTDKATGSSTVVVRCLKKTEITIDDLESFLGKSITVKVTKAKN